MDKFNFLLGDWKLEYNIPESMMSKKATGHGKGTFKKALDDHYVFLIISLTLMAKQERHTAFLR